MTLRPSRSLLVLIAVAVLATGCGRLDPLSTEEALDRLTVATSRVFDAEGNVIANLHGEINRDIVELEQIPAHVRDAVIAVEDERFWAHQGVDVRSITRALLSNLGREPEENIQGGSTISQQLAKNLYFPRPDRTVSRKVAEARVTLQLERQYTKEEILAMYLNTIYLGRGVYGIETAARSYFKTSASKLSLEQGAFLAGLIHEPARYEWTPTDPRDRRRTRLNEAQQRRNYVIDRMRKLDMISDATAEAAKQSKLRVKPPIEQQWKHPYFVDLVLRQLGVLRNSRSEALDPRFDFLGSSFEERSRNVYLRGLRIYTTLDPAAQQSAEKAVKVLPAELERLSVALAAIEPGTGYLRALIGGRDYYPDCDNLPAEEQPPVCELAKVNLALGNYGGGTGRQPGSSFKPFVLAAALQRGISLHQSFSGAEFVHRYQGSTWDVNNYEGSGGGSMTLVEGTTRSVNAVFARLEIEGVGEGDALKGSAFVAETARRMGIGFPTRAQLDAREIRDGVLCKDVTYGTLDRCLAADDVPSIALGAKEVSPLDMASAYGTFANDGIRAEPTAIVKIEDANGRILYDADPEAGRVLPAGVARGVTHALRRVIQGGTGTAASIDRPAAGKTGTSQAWRDAWFAGFVPQLSAVIWVGNPIPLPTGNESMIPSNGYPRRIVGGSYPAMIWKSFMTDALQGVPVREFRDPPQAVFRGGSLPSSPTGATGPTGLTGSEAGEGPPGTVPSVIGSSFGGASSRLKSAGYDVNRSRGCDPSGRAGLHEVYSQSPGGGSQAAQGSTVTIQYQGGGCN